jgi:hypothetical protein
VYDTETQTVPELSSLTLFGLAALQILRLKRQVIKRGD